MLHNGSVEELDAFLNPQTGFRRAIMLSIAQAPQYPHFPLQPIGRFDREENVFFGDCILVCHETICNALGRRVYFKVECRGRPLAAARM